MNLYIISLEKLSKIWIFSTSPRIKKASIDAGFELEIRLFREKVTEVGFFDGKFIKEIKSWANSRERERERIFWIYIMKVVKRILLQVSIVLASLFVQITLGVGPGNVTSHLSRRM
jgi:hypothetical protein